MKKVANRCNLKTTEDLLASLGFGGLTLHQVLNRLREEIKLQTEDVKNDSDSEIAKSLKSSSNLSSSKPDAATKSPISGIEGLDVDSTGNTVAAIGGGLRATVNLNLLDIPQAGIAGQVGHKGLRHAVDQA